jgi:hypothetical protein
MNENNKSFYPSDMFEFIHHPEYGCRSLKGLKHRQNSFMLECLTYVAKIATEAKKNLTPTHFV